MTEMMTLMTRSGEPWQVQRMPALHKLSPRRVQTLVKPGRHGDGGGLYLHVDPPKDGQAGSKRWVFVFHAPAALGGAGRRREMGLGSLRAVGLADAREKARLARDAVAAGRDPRAVRDEGLQAKRAKPTFAQEAALLLESRRADWRGLKTEARFRRAVEGYAAPFADRAIDEITTEDVLAILQPIWRTKPEMAQKVRSAWERVFDAAKARALGRQEPWAQENPARWSGHLALLLSKPIKLSRGHHPALAADHVQAFIAALRAEPNSVSDALDFTILTGVRTSTTLGATWSEVDFDKAVWSVPLTRMKNGDDLAKARFSCFRIPLAPSAVDLLHRRRASQRRVESSVTNLIFEGTARNGGLSINAMRDKALALEYPNKQHLTVHGFRTTFRVWGARQMFEAAAGVSVRRFSNEALEFALGHVVGNVVQRAYDRSDYFDERIALMLAWSDYLALSCLE